MKQNVYFMALGGGQKVGASCYYLRLGDRNLILDAGSGYKDGLVFEPNLHALLTSPFLYSMNQIDQIYISHAHMDHIGYLLKLMQCARESHVYMTELTAVLAEYQLYDKKYLHKAASDEEARLAAQNLLEKVAKVCYHRTLDFGSYRVTFFPAGHIPGAMMMLFEVGKKKILYTGDYSLERTALTNGCSLPEGVDIDVLILCGLHANHPDYQKRCDSLFKTAKCALRTVLERKQPICCCVSQLSKGIEFLRTLQEWNTDHVPIYLDVQMMGIVEKMERLSIPLMDENTKLFTGEVPREAHILITTQKGTEGNYYKIPVKFSLHEDFSEMQEFIRRVNPKTAILVHCEKRKNEWDDTIEQIIMRDSNCRTQFIFAEESELYQL